MNERKVYTLRVSSETYEKVRVLAFNDRRSIAMEIEHILLKHIAEYEKNNGEIILPPNLSEEE